MATSKQTTTLPKTTQIGLNYWNSTTKVSNCEFETQLAEPVTLKQGDSVQVRNVFLDASKINSEVIDLSADTELEMSFMFYAMMRKTDANLGNMNTDSLNISNGWISATSFYPGSADSNVDRIKDRWNVTETENEFDPPQFVNPLHNYAELAMAGYWRGNYNNTQDPTEIDVLYDVTKSRWAQNPPFGNQDGLTALYSNNAPAPNLCRYNVDMSVPTNNKAVNEPVYLFNPVQGNPYIRTVKITIPKGVYSREELAVKITSQLAELKVQPQERNTENDNYQTNGNLNDIYTADVVDVNGNAHPKRHIIPFKSRFGSGANPFQASIRFGYLSLSEKGTEEPFDYTNWTFSTNQDGQVNLPDPLDPTTPIPEEAIVDEITLQPMTSDLIGFCDESGLYNTLEEKKAHKNPQVCWTPLCKNFKIIDDQYGGLPSGGLYDKSQVTSIADDIYGDNIGQGFYDSRKTFFGGGDYFGLNLANDNRTNAYNIGNINLMMYHHWIFSPTANFEIEQYPVDNLVGGTFGTSEIAITYNDNNNSKFAFNFMHTPIQKAVDQNSGPVPVVVRQVSSMVANYRSDLNRSTDDSERYGSNYRSTSYADRHSGILFTGLRAKQNGELIDFWEGILGFDLNDILVKPPKGIFYNNFKATSDRGKVNPTMLPYEEFLKKSTGSIYGISFQQNQQLLSANLNNELMYTPDFFSEGLPTILFNDTIIESEQASTLVARNLPASLLSDLGGSILCEITGYSSGDLQNGKDLLAVKSIVSLYYLSDNSYISSEVDPFIYYHLSTVNHTISKLKVRFLNPITQQVIPDTVLGNKNSLFLAITNQIRLFA